jgi:hypothetical protein
VGQRRQRRILLLDVQDVGVDVHALQRGMVCERVREREKEREGGRERAV